MLHAYVKIIYISISFSSNASPLFQNEYNKLNTATNEQMGN